MNLGRSQECRASGGEGSLEVPLPGRVAGDGEAVIVYERSSVFAVVARCCSSRRHRVLADIVLPPIRSVASSVECCFCVSGRCGAGMYGGIQCEFCVFCGRAESSHFVLLAQAAVLSLVSFRSVLARPG